MSKKSGTRIRELRKGIGMTQAQLAEKVNKAESTVRMWELGKSEPDNSTLVLLSKTLGKPIDYILGNELAISEEPPELVIPDILKGSDVRVAFSGGAVDGLTQDDVDMLHELALKMAEKNKKQGVADD